MQCTRVRVSRRRSVTVTVAVTVMEVVDPKQSHVRHLSSCWGKSDLGMSLVLMHDERACRKRDGLVEDLQLTLINLPTHLP